MGQPQFIQVDEGGELVVLSRRDYDALLAAAGDEAAEDRMTDRLVTESRAAIKAGEEETLPGWLVFATLGEGMSALEAVRRHVGRTREDLANVAGVTLAEVAAWESTAPPVAVAPDLRVRLAAALGVAPHWLALADPISA